MKRAAGFVLVLMGALFASGCGRVVGDPCTTRSDCSTGVCLTGSDEPGGYCSAQCTVGSDSTCPSGNTCVKDAIGSGVAGCFKECTKAGDCRDGYICRASYHDNPNGVCVGANAT